MKELAFRVFDVAFTTLVYAGAFNDDEMRGLVYTVSIIEWRNLRLHILALGTKLMPTARELVELIQTNMSYGFTKFVLLSPLTIV